MSDDTETHTEKLLSAESELRQAAVALAAKSCNETRKRLREAALLYADASNDVDEAMELLIATREESRTGGSGTGAYRTRTEAKGDK